ncbi:MAG: tyrosine-type recombinase/integrase [Coriobacteriales bacterium]
MSKGDGSIINRGAGIWDVQISFGKNPVTGKYEKASKRVHGTKADARRVRDELRRQHESGLSIEGRRETFGEFATEWLDGKRSAGKVTRTTIEDYESILEKVFPYIGGAKMADITPKMIDSLYTALRTEHGYSDSRIRKYHMCINQVFRQAVKYDLIIRNPLDCVECPSLAESDRSSLSLMESRQLLETLDRSTAEAYEMAHGREGASRETSLVDISRLQAVRIALGTGMRRGEVLGLAWEDIDLDGGTISVRHSLTVHGELKEPKTSAGKRRICIDSMLLEALREWKSVQSGLLGNLGLEQIGATPVCCDSIGGFISTSNFSRWWAQYRGSIGFEGLKFHELRHTQATQLLANGVDVKTVQARMGHSSATLTLNWYAHAVPENDRRAADLLGGLLKPSEKIVKLRTA